MLCLHCVHRLHNIARPDTLEPFMLSSGPIYTCLSAVCQSLAAFSGMLAIHGAANLWLHTARMAVVVLPM